MRHRDDVVNGNNDNHDKPSRNVFLQILITVCIPNEPDTDYIEKIKTVVSYRNLTSLDKR